MQTTIQRVHLPDASRILMISDIHGHAAGLRALLKQVHFGKQDVLVIVGDVVEKGPESLETVRFVMELCENYTVYPLMGNVDLGRIERLLSDDVSMQEELLHYSLKARKWWDTCFLEELCREIGVSLEPQMNTAHVFARLRAHFEKEFAFLASLPTVLETQNMIFVHGGIPHERLGELAGHDCYPLLKRDSFLNEGLSFQKYVAVGHWPVALYGDAFPCHNPIIDSKRHIICLDGGCGIKNDGQLNLLSIPCGQLEDFELHTWDALPVIVAEDQQDESKNSCHIRWTRELLPVKVIKANGEMTHISYLGHELDVPSEYIYSKDGTCYCDDITDHRLHVNTGDKLSLIYANSYGCYVKKNGVTGWYMGRYRKNA